MTIHRFVHLGDLHLGPNSRDADRIAALDQAIAEQILQPVSAWLFPGDLNHGRMTIEDRNVLVARLSRMADHAPVVIAYGNHDLAGDLDVFAKLHTVWPIFVIARPQVIEVPLTTGGYAAIFVLPYPTRAGLVSAGVASGSVVDAARQALDTIFMAAAAEMAKYSPDVVRLAIGHVNVGGSIVSTGQPNIGQEIELDPALIQRLGPIYVGLNHIHKAQEIGGAFYAGSMCRLDWGETDEKSYIVVTYGPGGWGGHAGDGPWNGCAEYAWDVERKPLTVAPMFHIEGELTRAEGFRWRIAGCDCGTCDRHAPLDWSGAEVRVRYRFASAEKTALDEAIVRAPFEGAKRLELDPIAVRERASRAPDVAAAETLDAKVQAYVRRSNVTWSPSLNTKLALLQNTPDGGAFLTHVQQLLSASRQTRERSQGDPGPESIDHAAAGTDADHIPQEVAL